MDPFKLYTSIELFDKENIDVVVNKAFDFTRKCRKYKNWIFVPLKFYVGQITWGMYRFFTHLAVVYYKRGKIKIDANDAYYNMCYRSNSGYSESLNPYHSFFNTYRYILLKALLNKRLSFDNFMLRMNYILEMYDNEFNDITKEQMYINRNTRKVYTVQNITGLYYICISTKYERPCKTFVIQ